ncbi:hypothetical protein FRC03_002201 [Tulasnella sp. 419]|nr:hypothetical protein FRC03_002201 [Tulasnella sp. 419]
MGKAKGAKFKEKIKYSVDTRVKCPDCNEMIQVGFRGPSGLEEHQGKKQCQKTVRKKKNAEVLQRQQHMFTHFKPVVKVQTQPALPPSAVVTAPAPILASQGISSSWRVPSTSRSAQSLPDDAQREDPTTMALFGQDPSALVSADIPDDEVWETVDPVLNNLLGFGKTSAEISSMIRRGHYGMDGMCRFFEYLVCERGLNAGLLEGKVDRVMQAISLLSPDYNTIVWLDPLVPPSIAPTTTQSGDGLADWLAIGTSENPVDVDAHPIDPEPTDRRIHNNMKEKRSLTKKCIGIYIELPEGHSPYGSYPFGMHDVHAIPWDLHITGDRLSIQSIECEKRKSRDVEACHPCTILSSHPILTATH